VVYSWPPKITAKTVKNLMAAKNRPNFFAVFPVGPPKIYWPPKIGLISAIFPVGPPKIIGLPEVGIFFLLPHPARMLTLSVAFATIAISHLARSPPAIHHHLTRQRPPICQPPSPASPSCARSHPQAVVGQPPAASPGRARPPPSS
jgi:hypothetical protein